MKKSLVLSIAMMSCVSLTSLKAEGTPYEGQDVKKLPLSDFLQILRGKYRVTIE